MPKTRSRASPCHNPLLTTALARARLVRSRREPDGFESRGPRIIIRRRRLHPLNPLFKFQAASDERRSFFATPASVDFLYQRGGFLVCRMALSQEPRERGWSDLQQCVHRAGGGSAVVRPALPASL